MIRRAFGEAVAEEAANGQAVGAAAGAAALAADVLEEADHEHFEIHHRVDAGAAAFRGLGIGGSDLRGEVHLLEGAVDPLVEGVGCRGGQLPGYDPDFLLLFLGLALLKHAGSL